MGKKVDIKIISKDDDGYCTIEIMDNVKTGMNDMINAPAVTTAQANLCYIINRLAENSNICKTIAIALVGAFISLTKDPTIGQFLFVVALTFILAFNDGIYMGLKESIQEVSEKLSFAAVKGDPSLTNPFSLKQLRNLNLSDKADSSKEDDKRKKGASKAEGHTESPENKGWKKIKKDVKTAWIGLKPITTGPFYLVILFGLLIYQFAETFCNWIYCLIP